MTEPIAVEVVEELSLSIFTVVGDVRADELVRVILEHFPEHRTDNSLWDLGEADLSVLAKDGIVRIAEAGQRVSHYRRADGRTAIVVQTNVERTLLRLYEAVNELQGSPRVYRFFDNRDDAIAWIGESAP